jgi:hypothetical protein
MFYQYLCWKQKKLDSAQLVGFRSFVVKQKPVLAPAGAVCQHKGPGTQGQ